MLIFSIIVLIILLVVYFFNWFKNRLMYKFAFKSIKTFSFSVILLLLFYTITFGFLFGNVSATQTYKQNLEDYHQKYHTAIMYDRMSRPFYYEDGTTLGTGEESDNNQFLTQPYWEFFLPSIPYDPNASWNDFFNLLIPGGYDSLLTTYEPIYGNLNQSAERSTYYFYGGLKNYLLITLYNRLYDSLDYEFYYKYTRTFSWVGHDENASGFFDYSNFNFTALPDYKPLENDYYKTWDEMVNANDSSLFKTQTKSDPNSYYLNDLEFTNFGYDENGRQYQADDLLAWNNHSPAKQDYDNDVIEVALSESFAKNNNVVLGQTYRMEFNTRAGEHVFEIKPIATFADSYSVGNSSYAATVLVNSLDFNKLAYGEFFSDGISYNASPSDAMLLQPKEFLPLSMNDITDQSNYEVISQSLLFQYVDAVNAYMYDVIVPAWSGDPISDYLVKQRIQIYESQFELRLGVNSLHEQKQAHYYSDNLNAAIMIKMNLIISTIIGVVIFLVVIFMMYSIIKKRIREDYKQFGVLKSFGYKINSISVAFLTFPMLLLLIGNFLAILAAFGFHFYILSQLTGIFYLSIGVNVFLPMLTLLLFSFVIIVIFSLWKIFSTLRRDELTLLRGKSEYSPNVLFRTFAKFGDNFHSFENSYMFKNIFKSFSKSALILFTVIFSLFFIVFSFTLSSMVKINSEQNLAAFEQDNIVYTNMGSLDRFPSLNLFPNAGFDTQNINDYANFEDAYLLGSYDFNVSSISFDASKSFEENYNEITYQIFDYISTNPLIERNSKSILDVNSYYELFDYSYITPQTTISLLTLYGELYAQYLVSTGGSMGDTFNEPGINVSSNLATPTYNENVTLRKILNATIVTTLYRWIIEENEFVLGTISAVQAIINQGLSPIETWNLIKQELQKLGDHYYDTFPIIGVGRTLYDPKAVTFFYSGDFKYYYPDSIKTTRVNFFAFESGASLDNSLNLYVQGSKEPVGAFLEQFDSNLNYIPVVVDKGVATQLNLEIGSEFYLNGSTPLKVEGIIKDADLGIVTLTRFTYRTGMFNSTNFVITDLQNPWNEFAPLGFNAITMRNLALNLRTDIKLLEANELGTYEDSYLTWVSNPASSWLDLSFIAQFSEQFYKFFSRSLLVSMIILLAIPMFMILISIKEVIDDNVVEVSMLKSLGYNTFKTSRLILSPYLLISFIALILVIPLAFGLFAILNFLMIKLLLLDLTFGMFVWQWVAIILLDLIIMFMLYTVSFYFYHKIKSKTILRNLF